MDNHDNDSFERLRQCKKILKQELLRMEKMYRDRPNNCSGIRNALWLQQISDSIEAASATIPPGADSVSITNIHTQQQESIPLNPKLSASENAALYRKKAKKAQNHESVERSHQMKIMREAMDCIASLTPQSDPSMISAAVIQATDALHAVQPAMISPAAEPASREKHSYRHYSVDGWNIYLGKTDEQNDELSIHFAAPSDLWFHVAGHAGSHVIIRCDSGSSPPQKVIDAAAALAAWFSKARHASQVNVHFCEARFVHKRRGTPAGEVCIEKFKSMRVVPGKPEPLSQ